MKKIQTYIERRRYEILLVSFLILMFGDTFLPAGYPDIRLIFLMQNMVTGMVIFYRLKRLRVLIGSLIISIVFVKIIYEIPLHGNFNLRSWLGIIYLIYFFIITVEVYRTILRVKIISAEVLSAVLCGFILLCFTGTFLFYQIEVLHPHSFSGLGEGEKRLTDLNYFSVEIITTIGLGEITPLSIVAKRAVMLIGLTGHFYTVFVMGIIIGKYISHSEIKYLKTTSPEKPH